VMQGVGGSGRAYHLIPRAASKARGVGRHMQARGYAAAEVIAVGDSREDLGAAAVVGTFWLVANALEREPGLRAAAAAYENVRLAEAGHGAGVYEAVITELAERR
jgi:phosphoglycolate phosphatase